MVEAVDDVSSEAVALACERFRKGLVPGRNNAFPPSGAELAVQSRLFHCEPTNLVLLHNGLIEMDWGGGKVRLAGLTTEEQNVVIAAKGRTEDGRTMAGMSLEDLRQAIYRPAIPLRRVR